MIRAEIEDKPHPNWNKLLLNSKMGTVYQTVEYANYVASRLKSKPFFINFQDDSGGIMGQLIIFQSFKGRGKFIKYLGRDLLNSLSSIASFILPKFTYWNYGPVVFEHEKQSEISECLGNLLVSWDWEFRGSPHPLNSDFIFSNNFNFKTDHVGTFIINLNEGLEKILDKTDKKSVKKNIERSQERGVTVSEIQSEKDIITYYELLNEHRLVSNLTSYSKHDVVNGFNLLKPVGQKGFLAWHDKIPIGGILFSSFNNYINEWGIARSRTDAEMKLYSIDLLRWKIIEWGVQNACTYYDLTGVKIKNKSSKDESLFRNKAKWGGNLINYPIFTNS